jgi:hypothetical protein
VIEVTVAPDPVPVGGRATARVAWTAVDVAAARGVLMTAGWRTEGRGDEDGEVVEEIVVVPGPGGSPPAGATLTFTVPADGPVSYDGRLLRIRWEIAVHVDVARGRDRVHTHPFRVVPRMVADGDA